MQEKSENFYRLRPILFELCKKNYRGGGQIGPPPPAGIGLKKCRQVAELPTTGSNPKSSIQILYFELVIQNFQFNRFYRTPKRVMYKKLTAFSRMNINKFQLEFVYNFSNYNFDTVLYKFFETGTSDRRLIGIV